MGQVHYPLRIFLQDQGRSHQKSTGIILHPSPAFPNQNAVHVETGRSGKPAKMRWLVPSPPNKQTVAL